MKPIFQEITWGICNFVRQKEEHSKDLQFKGGSDLVWYSIERDIFKTESILLQKKQINPV